MNCKIDKLLLLLAVLVLLSCGRPIADFSYSGGKEAPAKVAFENKSKEAETYEWDFGDGNKSSEVTPIHRYTNSGNYTVILKVQKGEKTATKKKQLLVDSPEECYVEIQTDYGNMLIHLYDATPQHRDNFIKLVEEGFYEDLLFHRVIQGFMIQGGDPNSRGAKPNDQLGGGGPGYLIPAEFVDSLIHVKGAVAAARTNNPEKKSSGSQFYIVQGRKVTDRDLGLVEARQDFNYSSQQKETYEELGGTPQLDREYTVFGMVIEGLDVIDKIAAVKTKPGDRPIKDVKMKMRVIR
jgi:cyclophilin family peptidyl-prolyl cis-trans isomerase